MPNNIDSSIEDHITLEYHGPRVELGRMDSYEVAANIIAFSDFLGVLSKTAYGERVELRTEIQGFRKSSFDIDFALYISGILATLISAGVTPSPKELIDLVKECIKAWIHLNGKPPKTLQQAPDNKNSIQVENQNGQIAYYNANIINIITDARIGKATEQFAKKPLESGIQNVCLRSNKFGEVAIFDQDNAQAFVTVNVEKPLAENELKMWLLIESATFKEGNKWRFFDGQNSFYVDIADEEFLAKVDRGEERFGKGDRLHVLMRLTQHSNLNALRIERTIIKVLEHIVAPEQGGLF